MGKSYSNFIFTLSFIVLSITLPVSCEAALKPEQTPQRVIIGFLKELGRGNIDGASGYVADESKGKINDWFNLLFFPEHQTPPTPEDEAKIDKFIGLFYKITVTNETDSQADVNLIWSATDALVQFPEVSQLPNVPNTSAMKVILVRPVPANEKEKPGDWKISSLEPMISNW